DGDPAAAYRYTEARLTRIAMAMLEDIDRNTVDFQANFDDRLQEPTVLPAKIPNLLVNGSSGIAVGMATNIPPHNLREVVKAVQLLVDNPDATIGELRKVIKGPDFPTGAYIYGRAGIKEAYENGRGRVVMQAREHILDGLKIAVDNIDEVIKIIRGSEDTPQADARLRKRFGFSEKQSDAILNMRLAKLTGLEIEKLDAELKEVRATIKELKSILASKPKRMGILKEEMEEIAQTFGDDRRTEIVADQGEFTVEDLIAEEDMVITISHSGYIKRIPITTYKRQRRGGRGLNGADLKADDWVEHLFIASTHDYLMFFSNRGQVYWLKVHEIPQAGRAARGKPVVNCIAMKPDEQIASLVPVREFTDDQSLIFATRQGTVKKTVLS